MSKELEALENIKSLFVGSPIDLSQQFNTIETALKRLEKIRGITCKEPKDADEILDFLLIRNKTLEIIKEKPIVALVDYKYTYEEWLELVDEKDKDLFRNKEEYELLKEVLL